jgi:hypothetical protein
MVYRRVFFGRRGGGRGGGKGGGKGAGGRGGGKGKGGKGYAQDAKGKDWECPSVRCTTSALWGCFPLSLIISVCHISQLSNILSLLFFCSVLI